MWLAVFTWWVPLAAAFDYILTECGYGGGDAAVRAYGPTHWGGGLGVWGGLRDESVCNSFAVLLPHRDVLAGRAGLGRLLVHERDTCASRGCPANGRGRWAGTSCACTLRFVSVCRLCWPLWGEVWVLAGGCLCVAVGVRLSSTRYTMLVPAAKIVAPNRGEINRHHFGPRSQNCGAVPRRNKQAQTVGLV